MKTIILIFCRRDTTRHSAPHMLKLNTLTNLPQYLHLTFSPFNDEARGQNADFFVITH